MAFIVNGAAFCNTPGCGKSWDVDVVLLVPFPDCQVPVGVGCRPPCGHSGPFVERHAARDLLADRGANMVLSPSTSRVLRLLLEAAIARTVPGLGPHKTAK